MMESLSSGKSELAANLTHRTNIIVRHSFGLTGLQKPQHFTQFTGDNKSAQSSAQKIERKINVYIWKFIIYSL